MKEIQLSASATCWIGQSARDNWTILDQSSSEDIIFHLTSFPSCYVRLAGDSTDYIQTCAELCRNNTKYRNVPNVYVDYTRRDNIDKGVIIGEMVYKSNRKVHKIKI